MEMGQGQGQGKGREGQEVNRNRGTNNKMQWKAKLVERWYAQSYRAGDHNRGWGWEELCRHSLIEIKEESKEKGG